MASVQTPPSAAAIAVATAIISGLTGYYIGQARSIGVFGTSTPRDDDGISDADAASGDEADADEEADDEDDVQDLQTFPGNDEECKLVLVVRTDLGMGKGMFVIFINNRQWEAVCDAFSFPHTVYMCIPR